MKNFKPTTPTDNAANRVENVQDVQRIRPNEAEQAKIQSMANRFEQATQDGHNTPQANELAKPVDVPQVADHVRIDEWADDYTSELREHADLGRVPRKLDVSDWRVRKPEETKQLRKAFRNGLKNKIIAQWEKQYGEWPRYTHDVILNGRIVHKAGHRYDAHHIQPLGLGGENTVQNIVPLHGRFHDSRYTESSVHRKNGPLGQLADHLKNRSI